MKELDGVPIGSFAWDLHKRLEYAEQQAEKLIDRYPLLAEVWLNDADQLRKRIANQPPTNV